MADKTTNGRNDAETVDAASIGKANNPISKATLIMIAAGILFLIIASVIIFKFFNAPTGNTGSDSTNAASSVNQ